MASSPTIARQLADWATSVRVQDIPEGQRRLAVLRLVDTIGLVFAGYKSSAAVAAYDMVITQGGRPESTLIGAGQCVPATSAALAHGTVAHCHDFDDTFPDSVVHPGSVVVPVALALGGAHAVELDRVLAAIVVGYEISARLGAAAGRAFHAHGFHASAIVGPLAAAATAARFLNLDSDRLASALGVASSMSGGLLEFMTEGTWSKWLHTGWAAHGGITAAQLAARGFLGPSTAIEGRYGLYRSFLGADAPTLEAMAYGLGRVWQGDSAHFKYYPCAHVIQPYIDAALDLRTEHGINPAEISAVACHIADWAVPIVCEPRIAKIVPSNEMEAIASLPYQVAAALVDGAVGLDTIADGSVTRIELRDLAARVVHVVDSSLGRSFDGVLSITLDNGTVLSAAATTAPPDPTKVIEKFRVNAGAVLSPDGLDRITGFAEDASDIDLKTLLGIIG